MATDIEEGLVLWQHVSHHGAVQTVVVQGVGTWGVTERAGGEAGLALIPSNLPDGSVAQPETSGHHIVPPHNKAPSTILEAVAAEGIVVTDGDAPDPLVVREMRCGEEGGSTDPRNVAR